MEEAFGTVQQTFKRKQRKFLHPKNLLKMQPQQLYEMEIRKMLTKNPLHLKRVAFGTNKIL